MRQFIRLVSRFRRDERGVFGIIFALLAIVLVAMSGAVVDFTTVQQARTKAQVALDSAALALQPSIYTSGITAATIQGQAQALLKDRLKDPVATQGWPVCATGSGAVYPCATVNSPTYDTTAGTLTLTATMIVPMNFVSLVGIPTMQVQLLSVATRQKLNLEVAMVLDNSGSMAYTMGQNAANGPPTRMDTLHSAADCAVNILFYNVTTCSASTTGITPNANTEIGLVPFTEAVNAVGKGNAVPWWVDQGGTSSPSISDNNFDNALATPGDSTSTVGAGLSGGNVNRISLFNEMGVQWGGCVEARKSPYDTDATPPSTTTPDTLYTPYLAPAEPTSGSGSYNNAYIIDSPSWCKAVLGNCSVAVTTQANRPTKTVVATTITVFNSQGNVKSGPTTTTTTTSVNSTTTSSAATLVTPTGVTTNSTNNPAVCTCTGETLTSDITVGPTANNSGPTATTTSSSTTSGFGTSKTTTTTSVTTTVTVTGTISVETQQCVAHYTPSGLTDRQLQERLCKYNGATLTVTPTPSSVLGPNGDCPAAPLAALSATPSTVISAIAAMQPVGGTNITEGAAWGFRELSPVDPFNAKPYNAATSKVLIIMTDGANTIYPGTNMNDDTFYSAYGYPWNGRLLPTSAGTSQLQSATALQAQMDTNLSTVCTNAKNAGITVYTIGIDVADSESTTAAAAANKTNLTNCATNSGDAYFPNTATDLQNAFVAIAGQLAALRLAK